MRSAECEGDFELPVASNFDEFAFDSTFISLKLKIDFCRLKMRNSANHWQRFSCLSSFYSSPSSSSICIAAPANLPQCRYEGDTNNPQSRRKGYANLSQGSRKQYAKLPQCRRKPPANKTPILNGKWCTSRKVPANKTRVLNGK